MKDNYFHIKYLEEGLALASINSSHEKTVCWNSPANIALIKYWGKHGAQLPNNPSISFTLSQASTLMSVSYQTGSAKTLELEFCLNKVRNYDFEKKLVSYLERLLPYFPFLNRLQLRIDSHNTFPHSAGIASSASSISALALCLCSIEHEHFNTLIDKYSFFQKASFLARIGSGSACRSIYGNTVLWGFIPNVADSSNEIAIPIEPQVNPIFSHYYDAILVVDSTPKELSSTAGHKLMNHHIYADSRNRQVNHNLQSLLTILSSGDELGFSQIVENEAFSLHGLLLSSTPGYVLLHPNTLVLIKRIKEFRAQSNLHFAFTLDAGPNVHILYHESIRTKILAFIESELKPLCENGFWIDDKVSEGPEMQIIE